MKLTERKETIKQTDVYENEEMKKHEEVESINIETE